MKCKNVECENLVSSKRIYCSLRCRNIYVNKYLRNYDKVSKTFQKKAEENESEYLKSPKVCICCDLVIPYEKRINIFCSIECAHKTINHSHPKTEETKSKLREIALNYVKAHGRYGSQKKERITPCRFCQDIIQNKNKEFCSLFCKNEFYKNKDSYRHYRQKSGFDFNLSDYPKEFDFSLIEEHGWYSPSNKKNNLSGVSRDHMFSVKEGYERGIDPTLISHPANCQLLVHNENISKNKKSCITLEELLERIEMFEIKYNSKNLTNNNPK